MPYLLINDGVVQAKYTSLPQLPPGTHTEEVDQAVFDSVTAGMIQDGAGGYRWPRWYDEYDTVELLKPAIKTDWKKEQADSLFQDFTKKFSADEMNGFAQSRAAADAFLAGTANASQTARIQNEADRTGKTTTVVANDIVANNDKYLSALGELNGFRSNVDQIVDDFQKQVGESEPQARERLYGLVEDERDSAKSDIDIIFGGA